MRNTIISYRLRFRKGGFCLAEIRGKVNFDLLIKCAAVITFVLIVVSAVLCKTEIYFVIPLVNSIGIMFLQSRVSRFAYLCGALNSIIYAITGCLMTLYSSAISAIAVSFPLQLITFISWSKNTGKNGTVLKPLPTKGKWLALLEFIVIWAVYYFLISDLDSPYLFLDVTSSALGLVVSTLSFLKYYDYALLHSISGVLGVTLYSNVVVGDISKLPWLIYSCYSLMCLVVAFINVQRRYRNKPSKEGESL